MAAAYSSSPSKSAAGGGGGSRRTSPPLRQSGGKASKGGNGDHTQSAVGTEAALGDGYGDVDSATNDIGNAAYAADEKLQRELHRREQMDRQSEEFIFVGSEPPDDESCEDLEEDRDSVSSEEDIIELF